MSACMTFTRGKQNISDENTISKSMLYIDISTSSFENRLSKLSVAFSVTSFFSINELRHSYPYRDSFVPHVRVFTSHVTHSFHIPLPSLVDIVFQIFSGIADSSNRNFWIPESRLSWIGRHSTLLSFDCEESNGCWTRFTCACSARTLNSARPLSPRLTFFIVYRWVSSINILILQVNVVKSQAF